MLNMVSYYILLIIIIHAGDSGMVVRISDSQSREPAVKSSCCHFEALANLFTSCCLSLLGCINEYLAIGNDGYVNE